MKKILIVGNSYALERYFSDKGNEVFVIGNGSIDIREDNPTEILDFALENDIDLTVVVSDRAIKSDIASVFNLNGQSIFAPTTKSAISFTNLSDSKKTLYKLHAPTPKFAVFEKLPLALEYLSNADYPLVIYNDSACKMLCCTTIKSAKCFVEDLFLQDENKIVIENYVYGTNFTFYVITDGYHALPLTSSLNFKFSENGDGGFLTKGVGSYVPNYKLPKKIQDEIFNKLVLNLLNYLQKSDNAYTGIIAVNGVLIDENNYVVLNLKSAINEIDLQAVLNCMDEDLCELFDACANGFFADEYEDILMNDNVSVSALIRARQDNISIENLDNIDSKISYLKNNYDNITVKGDNFILTSCAKTLYRAKSILKEDIELINFTGIKCRSDIYN